MIRTLLLLLTLLPFAIDASPNETFDDAMAAMRAGDYAKAYCRLRPLAEDGHGKAQYTLGWMYHNGYGLRIDDDEARRWWERAAQQGHAEALFSLGMLYELGNGVTQDEARAVGYYIRAARRGLADARDLLRARLGEPDQPGWQSLSRLLEEDWQLFDSPLRVTVDRANVRDGPGTDHAVVATLDRGHQLVEIGHQGKWIEVGIAGQRRIGWVYAPLVAPAGAHDPDP